LSYKKIIFLSNFIHYYKTVCSLNQSQQFILRMKRIRINVKSRKSIFVNLNLSVGIFAIEDNTKHKFEIINTSHIFVVIRFLKVILSKRYNFLRVKIVIIESKLVCLK